MKTDVLRLKERLDLAARLDPAGLVRQLSGFGCEQCGECCQAAFGDNTVAVFPFEIERLKKLTGLNWLEIASPGPIQYKDSSGTPHCFEWTLKHSSNGDCLFFKDEKCRCYPERPLICQTYPFYLTGEGVLATSECRGLKKNSRQPETATRGQENPGLLQLARDLKKRFTIETQEAISFIENLDFRDFRRTGDSGLVVHDSRGAFYLTESGVEAL